MNPDLPARIAMKTLPTAIAAIGLALSAATTFAQDGSADAARQQRMDAAYAAHHDASPTRDEDRTKHDARAAGGSGSGSSGSLRQDARHARHSIHEGARETGHAIHRGLRATGHAIHDGAKATGHAIHKGFDKVTGK
jgi:hypothetical protein